MARRDLPGGGSGSWGRVAAFRPRVPGAPSYHSAKPDNPPHDPLDLLAGWCFDHRWFVTLDNSMQKTEEFLMDVLPAAPPNHSAAANPAATFRWRAGRHWRRFAEKV